MKTTRHLGLLLLSAALAACGGGNSDGPVTPGAAQGFYTGNTAPDFETMTLILENDEYWSILGHTHGNTFYPHYLVQGGGVSRSGRYSGSDLRDFDYFEYGDAALSASYQPGASFFGRLTYGLGIGDFSLNAPLFSLYNYNTPANLANVAGSWRMTNLTDELDNHIVTVDITAGGALTGSSLRGCGITGTLTQRPSGKNVFNVTMQFNSACVPANETVSGIAVEYLLPGGAERRLVIAGVNRPARNDASVLVGKRL